MPDKYSNFRVLLDESAGKPGLRFTDYADALSETIVHSKAEFAIGIFGSWGSGKTTLMRAVEDRLALQPGVTSAWFTAWRYEKEPSLIVPLLDVLRERLDEIAGSGVAEDSAARRAARAISRAGKAFLAAVTLTAKAPGVEAKLEPQKFIDQLMESSTSGSEAMSLFHSGFRMLKTAITEFSGSGTRRVVIFIDDLDRCLPENAIDVLESMKLFFDVEGVVFVVGLDQEIVARAVDSKYSADGSSGSISGAEYIKKIFQVPFSLPRVATGQLDEYLSVLAADSALDAVQLEDFNLNVRRHLRFLVTEDAVNPREIKRLINTYVLQLRILSKRLGGTLDPNVVLAIQCISSRPDWTSLYFAMAADPPVFQQTVRQALQETPWPTFVWMATGKIAMPPEFLSYLAADARSLLDTVDIQSYVSAAEFTHSTDPTILEGQILLNQLRRLVDEVGSSTSEMNQAARDYPGHVSRVRSILGRRLLSDPAMQAIVDRLESLGKSIFDLSEQDSRLGWTNEVNLELSALNGRLQELRAQTSVGPWSA